MTKTGGTLKDAILVSAVALSTTLPYVTKLGFYGDDWGILPIFRYANSQSLRGLVVAIWEALPHARMRPVQLVYLAGLYRLFGTEPHGYHLVNAGVFVALVLMFHLALRELGASRVIALATPLVFATMPNYSTARFWVAAAQVNLSILLFFVVVWGEARAARGKPDAALPWTMLSVGGVLASALAYEVALPLFVIPVCLAWRRSRAASLAIVFVLVGIVTFKAMVTDRAGIPNTFFAHLRYVYTESFWLHYVSYGLALPRVVWNVIRANPDPARLIIGCSLGAAVSVHLLRRGDEDMWSSARAWVRVIGLGLVVFVLGYSIFVSNSEVGFTKAGPGNRTAMAAAIGAAVSFVGMFGLLASVAPAALSRRVFVVLVSVLCAAGVVITDTIASFWIEAYERQRTVLQDLQAHVPRLASGSTVILDGVCPYAGPAVVFESQWDLAGALKLAYRDPTLQADVMSALVRVDAEGFLTTMYGEDARYPYGDRLFVYQFADKHLHPMVDVDAARRYWERFHADGAVPCPPSMPGRGVAVF